MAPTAERAILCGDPARALLLAQELMSEPRMSNHHRGLWGYFGTTTTGTGLTIQGTGIGSQSAVLVLAELAAAGVRSAIRVGSCVCPGGELRLGTSIVAASASRGRETGEAEPAQAPDSALTAALVEGGAGPALDLLSAERLPRPGEAPPAGAVAVDLQTAALFAEASELGVAFAAALVVADSADEALEDDAFEAEAIRLGRIAVEALEGLGRT